jgi:hypothetical protein
MLWTSGNLSSGCFGNDLEGGSLGLGQIIRRPKIPMSEQLKSSTKLVQVWAGVKLGQIASGACTSIYLRR